MDINFFKDISSLQDWSQNWLERQGIAEGWTSLAAITMNIILLFIICWVCYAIARFIIRSIVRSYLKKTKNPHDDIFIEKNAFIVLAHIVPGLLVYHFTPFFFNVDEKIEGIIHTLAILYIIIMVMVMIIRILHALEYMGLHSEKYKRKPVSSFIQMCVLIVYIIFGVLILSILIGKSLLTVFAGFGASMAIILLIFRDTILGLVASVQLATNDMVRLGDWITVPNYNADGDLIEITLMTVKVRNWDKTVTHVPTYALVSNGFQNCREMQDMNIRRIMQHLYFDINSIKSVDEKFFQRLKQKKLIDGEIKDIQWNNEKGYTPDKITTLTNLGLFRKYTESYLNSHPGVSDTYIVVRHLQPTSSGLPIGIYVFSKDVSWKPLNALQADIFEHLIVVADEFDLVLFQSPAGEDFLKLSPLETVTSDKTSGEESGGASKK